MISLNTKPYTWNKFFMASAADFCEDNGNAAGSPPKGTSRTFRRSEMNFKNIDDSTTAYSSSPITTGSNSYEKWQFLAITGTFNQISAGKWGHTAGVLGAGLKLVTVVTSGYHTPTTTTLSSGIDITTASGLDVAYQPVLFSTTGPCGTQCETTLSATGYTEYLVTQLNTNTDASPGDTTSCTFTCSFTEN